MQDNFLNFGVEFFLKSLKIKCMYKIQILYFQFYNFKESSWYAFYVKKINNYQNSINVIYQIIFLIIMIIIVSK